VFVGKTPPMLQSYKSLKKIDGFLKKELKTLINNKIKVMKNKKDIG